MGIRRVLFRSGGACIALVLAVAVVEVRGAQPLAEVMASTPNRINPWAAEASRCRRSSVCWAWTSSSGSRWGRRRPRCRSRWSSRGANRHRRAARSWCSTACWPAAPPCSPPPGRWPDAGYRAVLVDLRGRGRSTGKYMTFGLQEAKDLSQVIDALAEKGLLAGGLGVYGISYGATTSIHLAAVDRRVRAVVAVEPFSTAREEVPHFARVMAPGVGLLIPDKTYQQSLDEAGRIAHFDPDEADAVKAIQRTSAPVLIVHGTNDWIVPHRAERAFARRRAGPQRAGVGPLPGARGAMARSGRARGPAGPRLVRPLALAAMGPWRLPTAQR